MAHTPVFIVGSPRSGTSILISALLRAGYKGYLEGNFLSLVHIIEHVTEMHLRTFYSPAPQVLTSRIDREGLKDKLAKVIIAEAARHMPAGPWVDKTGGPEMIEAIPIIRRVYPRAKFILARRRAIENIVSRLIKFPDHNFKYHCMDWARTMAAWHRLIAAHPTLDAIEIDQRDISIKPEDVAKKLGDFLNLTTPMRQMLTQIFTSQRPQETRPGTADRILTLEETGWSDAQKAIFHEQCDAQMQAFGYTTDKLYRV